MVKISEFIIGILLFSFIAVGFGFFMSEMNSNYGVSYDNTSLESYQQLETMNALAEDIEQGSDISERTGVLDIIGGYFTDAYNVLILTKSSFNTFDTMSNQAVSDANLGKTGNYLRILIGAIVLILIVLGVIISAIVKMEL